jgi:hypothetical protein
VVDHRDGERQWLSVDSKWRIGYPIPEAHYVPEASGWEQSATIHEKGKLGRAKVLFHDPSVMVLVSIQSDGGQKPISMGPLLPIIPLFFLPESGPTELLVDVEFHVPGNEANGPVEIDLLQTKVRFDDREVSPIIHKRTHRSSPAMTEINPLPDCYAGGPDCSTTILPGDLQTGQLYVREFNESVEFELDLPPMRLEGGRVVDPPSIHFTQSTSMVSGINTADPY